MTSSAPAEERDAAAVLTTHDVAVHYGGIKAVDGIDLELLPGCILGVLGPNGSGKSTLLGALTRLVPLTRGQLLLDGQDYSRKPPASLAARGIARTFQTVRLLPGSTVMENVALGADLGAGARGRLRKALRGGVSPQVTAAIEQTAIGPLLALRPGELSYGLARRVEIARALAARPRVLLLDEPTAGMNPPEREEVAMLLKSLRGEGLAQLLIEHDVAMMVDTCDQLVAMDQGRAVATGDPGEVVRSDAVQQSYLGKGRGRARDR